MELFSENGFRGTSITQIETAAGLTPGAGGIYHHFRTKEALLEAGIARNLERLTALRDIGRLMTDLGDLRAELTIVARYVLTELDNEQPLIRIMASEARTRPRLMERVREQLVQKSFSGFARWLEREADITPERAAAVTAVGLGALLSSRLMPTVFGADPTAVDDETFVRTWVTMMLGALAE